MNSAVAYYRVSTQRQERSGLGIEAQRAAVCRFAEAEGITILSEFTEVETGKGADALDRRPQLAAALASAHQAKCPVVVAKLDRLTCDLPSSRMAGVELGADEMIHGIAITLVDARGGKVRLHLSIDMAELLRERVSGALDKMQGP